MDFKYLLTQSGIACVIGLNTLLSVENVSAEEVRTLVVPRTETTLSSQINARITKLNVKAGERFKKGKNLITFDCRLYYAQLNKARAQLKAAKKTVTTNNELKQYQAISQLEVEMAKAELAKAKAEVNFNSTQASLCAIKAPYSGRVVKRHVSAHSSVSVGDPILDILDDSQLELQLNIPSKWLAWVKVGTDFSVRIDETQREYTAKILRLGARVDAVSQTIEIAASVKNQDDYLLSGMSGVAHFNVPER